MLKYLKEELLHNSETTELSIEDDLLGSGLMDSLSLMRMVAFLEERFATRIPPEDLVIENFETVSAIATYFQNRSVTT